MKILAPNPTLRAQSRLPTLTPADDEPHLTPAELVTLLFVGAGIAATFIVAPHLHLRLPGHVIVQILFPMTFGVALVPRLGSATLVSLTALAVTLVLQTFDLTKVGAAGLTCFAVGPVLDTVLVWTRRGWQVYLGFVLASLGINLVALLVRSGFKFAADGSGSGGGGGGGGGGGHHRTATEWWDQAEVTFPIWGLAAGLLAAAIWFRLRERRTPDEAQG